jgi:hypothetical protein
MKKRHIALMALVGVIGGLAMPMIASAADGNNIIHACINNRSGALRVVADAGQCSSSETAISWNRQGGLACWDSDGDGTSDKPAEDTNGDGAVDVNDCRGPAGADGAPGADGADGAPGQDGVDGAPGADGTDGVSCWDLNGNGTSDTPAEDTNGDGVVDTADCRGSDVMSASVSGTGVVTRGDAVSATLVSTGFYRVTFARPVTGCSGTASPGTYNGGSGSLIAIGFLTIGLDGSNTVSVRFNKFDQVQTAVPVNTDFHLILSC